MKPVDHLLVSVTVYGASAIVNGWLIFQLIKAGKHTKEPRLASFISVGLVGWAAIAVLYSQLVGLTFPKLIPMLLLPWSIGLWLAFSARFSKLLIEIPVHYLVATSVYRIAGLIFVYCYYFCDNLSRGFALNAGWGDFLTGVLAFPVAIVIKWNSKYSAWALYAWSIIGIGDLIVAPLSAAIYGAQQLTEFPINLIPLYLGPPFGIMLHFFTLRAFWLQKAHGARQPEMLSPSNAGQQTCRANPD